MLRLRQDILLFPEGKKKAFTMSYDDGISQDKRLLKIMNNCHLKGTFNLNSGLMGKNDWLIQPGIDINHYKLKKEEIRKTYDGNEVAVHTMTHPNLIHVPKSMIAYEIAENKKELEDLVQHPVRGMAYPFGTWNQTTKEVAENCGIVYSRTVESTHNFHLPPDFLEWNPTCHHTEKVTETLITEFLKPIPDDAYLEPQLFYLWGHSYEFDAYEEWGRIEKMLHTVADQKDVWYTTNIDIYEYVTAAKQLIYSSTGDYISNPSALDIWIMIDQKTYWIKSGDTVIINSSVNQ